MWQAFSKFIKNQVEIKNKVVDTKLIGLFSPSNDRKCVIYPSPEYLEAGRFKLQKQFLVETNGDPDYYKEQFDEKNTNSVSLNFGAISLVSN